MQQAPQSSSYRLQVCFLFIIFAVRRLSLAHLIRGPHRAMRRKMQCAVISTNHQLQIPMIDDRVYAQFTLRNGIPVTVVHDRTSEKSSCSLAVKTGAMYDPLPGIAHITEHAVFLGSEKYPVENAYKDFLNKNGGSSNAGTSMEHTTYKFTVNQAAFDKAIDIFSQFFKGPLFSTEAMCREVMAVDSEDSKNRIIDSRRLLQVLKHQVDPDSQYAKFSTGNLKTLVYGDVEKYGQNLASTIRSFHDEHYLPERMAVALVGPQSVAELQRMAEEHFSNIAIMETEPAVSPRDLSSAATPLLEEAQLEKVVARCTPLFVHGRGKLIKMRPVKDLRDMTLIWELPPSTELYREDPCALLGYLLGHKGEGSWFAALQDKKWATSTSAGVRTTFPDFTLFEATVSLTEEGLQHWMSVMALLYKKVEAIQSASDEQLQTAWAEMRAINALDFQYKEKSSAYELAPRLAANMLVYRSDHILSAGWLMDDHVDVPLLRRFVDKLGPDSSLVVLRSKEFGGEPAVSLGNDDAQFIDESYAQYEAHYYDLAALTAGDSEVAVSAVSSDEVVTSPVTPTEALEAKKLSGEYFADLRRFHDAAHLLTSTAERGAYRTEPFYGVPYYIEDLNLELNAGVFINISDVKVSLPDPNPYVCTELMEGGAGNNTIDLTAGAEQAQRPLRSTPPTRNSAAADSAQAEEHSGGPQLQEVWHSRDEVFRQPRSIYFHLLESPSCSDGHPVLSLVSQVFSQVTARKYYQPAVAGLSYSLSIGPRGVGLNFFGYTPKLAQFAETVSRDVGDLAFWAAVPDSVIENSKDRLLRTFKSWVKERPDSQCEGLMRYLLQEGTWLPQDRLSACEATDRDYFHRRVADMLRFDRITSYGHGSCDLGAVQGTHLQVLANMKVPDSEEARRAREIGGERSRVLPKGSHQVHALHALNKEDPNSALVTFFQADGTSPRTSALMLFLRRLLGEPAFTELRTKQQLGYIVSLAPTGYGRGWKAVRGVSVRILSKRFSPLDMEKSLFEFLAAQRDIVSRDLTEEAVRERCESIIRSLQDPPTTYSEEASDFWDSIVHDMPFDWIDLVTAELRQLDRAAVLRAAELWMFDPATRASASMMIFAPEHESERERLMRVVTVVSAAVEGDVPVAAKSHSGAGDVTYAFTMEEMTAQRDRLEFCNTTHKRV